MELTKNEAILRDLVIDLIHRAGVGESPHGYQFRYHGRVATVGVPVKGNAAREVLISKLCHKGELHYTGCDVQAGLVFLAIGAGKGKSKPLPWESALLANNSETGEEDAAVANDPGPVRTRARGSSPPPDATRPCCCGCGGLARKAFVVTHDAKFSSMLGKLAKGVLSAEEAEAVTKQAYVAWGNEHVRASAYFQKKFKAAGLA